jgi:hypothetical protein
MLDARAVSPEFSNANRNTLRRVSRSAQPTFIDVFAGCGGLSLGLMQAGWQGLFAIERDRHAFETLSANLIADASSYRFSWPTWLPKHKWTSAGLLRRFPTELQSLRSKVDLLVGGPPCQGFSTAGRRVSSDPRNRLMLEYLRLVQNIRPRMVLVENVRGFTMDFKGTDKKDDAINYRRTPKDWAGLISGARGGASHWREVFDEHREVFRLSRIHEDEYSLVYRRAKSGKNATSEELEEGEQFEGKNRPPLMPEEISMLIDVALDLQKSMVEARTARRWWVAPVVTVIAGVTTVLVVIFKR